GGSAVTPTAAFCGACGVPTESSAAVARSAGGLRRRIVKITVAAVAATAALAAAAAFAVAGPEKGPTPTPAVASSPVPTTGAPEVSSSTTTTTAAPPDARRAWSAILAGHPGAASSPVGPITATGVVAEGRTAF